MTTSSPPQPDARTGLRLAVPITVFAVLVALGIFHGVWNDRWDKANDPAAVTAKLQRTPLSFADWDGQDETATLPETPPGMIGPTAVRRYVNRKTGDVVLVYLTAGRPGPLLVNHQPTDCYPAFGYDLASGPTRFAVPLDAGSAEFLVGQFNKTDGPVPSYLRVFWSFSGSGTWQVPGAPRLTFARYPTLYKLYVIRNLRKPNEPLEGDPANACIKALLPELEKTLFAQS
jgi:hypothetical protein